MIRICAIFEYILLLLIVVSSQIFSQPKFTDQDPNCIKLGQESEILEPAIDFLEYAPTIDGILDETGEQLPLRGFNYVRFHAEETFSTVPLHYRLGYGTEFLYVYVEVDHDQMFYNDRAFQNGDGFQVLIAKPQKNDERTDEFYVIACSAVNRKNLEWTKRIIFVNNIYNLFVPLSEDAKMEYHDTGEKFSFELLLPWKDIPPFHPWLSDDIGFNLKFVKAFQDQPTSDYYVYPDRDMAQENKMPLYCHLKFAEPEIGNNIQHFIQLGRNHIYEGDEFGIHIVTLTSEKVRQTVNVSVYSIENDLILNTSKSFYTQPGLDRTYSKMDEVSSLPTGQYTIQWETAIDAVKGEDQLTIFNTFHSDEIKLRLRNSRHRISKGSYETLFYSIERAQDFLASLRPYESAPNTRDRIEQLVKNINNASSGIDVIATHTGVLRRAFQSKVDSTYQPYCVRIPEHIDRSRKYPLIVFLHGSGSDETDLFGFSFLNNGECIELGPFARGRSNFYCTDNAQEDIAEAIDAVIENYPVDTDNIILTGFSMGGYGVYRTFHETPHKFKALAVFSGLPYYSTNTEVHPDSIYTNFLDDEKAKVFENTPLFIFHGEQDKNCSISKTEELVKLFKDNGVQVTYVTEKEKGHQRPDSHTIGKYRKWLDQVLTE